MIKVGDQIEIESERVGQRPRGGVVTGVKDRLFTIRWEDGRESSLMPKSGSLRLVRRRSEDVPAQN
jgi:hypothetical protein